MKARKERDACTYWEEGEGWKAGAKVQSGSPLWVEGTQLLEPSPLPLTRVYSWELGEETRDPAGGTGVLTHVKTIKIKCLLVTYYGKFQTYMRVDNHMMKPYPSILN